MVNADFLNGNNAPVLDDDLAGFAPPAQQPQQATQAASPADAGYTAQAASQLQQARVLWREGKVVLPQWLEMFTALLQGAGTPGDVLHQAEMADLAYMQFLRRQNAQK